MICDFMVRRRIALCGVCAALALAGCGKPAGNGASAPAAASPASQAAATAGAADAAAAKAFLEGLYAHYQTSKDNTFQMFDADVAEVFDADMVKLLAEDTKSLKGELGEIDGDWLCECQDFASLRATIAVQSASPTQARATADFSDVGMPGEGARHNAFELVKTAAGWRIHDIQETGQPSLRRTLEDEIKSLKAGGSAVSGPDAAP
jgi:hypothetical protein